MSAGKGLGIPRDVRPVPDWADTQADAEYVMREYDRAADEATDRRDEARADQW